MRNTLLIIFGLLIAVATIIEGVLAVQTARKAVTEKIETHLKDKATDIAEVIDGRLHSFFQFIEGIARMPFLYDSQTSAFEKARLLNKEAHFNKAIQLLAYIDLQGNCSLEDGSIINLSEREYLKRILKGEKYISEPYISKMDKSLVLTLSVPVYDSERNISGVLMTDISGFWLADQIKDIVVGKTGECYVIDQLGYTIADKDRTLVESRSNASEEAKTNGIQTSLAAFEKKAMETGELSVGCYEYSGIKKIASSAKIKSTSWTVIIAGIPHYNACNTLLRQSSRLSHRRCLWRSAIIISRTDGTAYYNAEFAIWQTSSIDCTFSFHCKSAAIRQSSPFDKGCGCRIYRNIFFAFTISEKSTCLRIFKTIFRKTLKFAAALSFRTRQ